MYDLDGTDDDDSVDITPEFMKHEDPEVEAPDADAPNPDSEEKE